MVGKYAPYFKDSTILPILELVVEVKPKTLSYIVMDLRTRRLAGLKKRLLESSAEQWGSHAGTTAREASPLGMSCYSRRSWW